MYYFLVFQILFDRILDFDVKAIKPMLSKEEGVRLADKDGMEMSPSTIKRFQRL
jgi:hypothetical protein